MLKALRQTREDGANHLSPSGANRCLRQAVFRAENDYYLDPEHQWASFIGTSGHDGIARADDEPYNELTLAMELEVPVEIDTPVWEPGDLLQSPEVEMLTVKVAGTTDKYDPEHQRIQDWKLVSEYRKFDPVLKRGADRTAADPDHVVQVNLYKMLLEANGYPVREAQIFYGQTYKEARRNVFDVELMEIDDIYGMAVELAIPIAQYQYNGTLPPRYEEDDDRYWLCRRCPVFDVCQRTP